VSHRLRLHPGARRELIEAARYYEGENPGLGGVFLARMQRAFDRILALPEACPVSRGSLRIKVLESFPYSVHYAVLADDVIIIVSIAHQSRRPFYWGDRM